MITFRKHAAGTTQRFDSRLIRRARGARAVPRIVASLAIIFAAANAAAASQQKGGGNAPSEVAGRAAEAPPKPDAGGEAGADAGPRDPQVPVKVYVAGTPEDPYIVARIGDFPTELGRPGDEFLKREFIEQFMRDVLGLKRHEGGAAALKIALLPQQNGQEQECSFTFGEVAGRITVRLSERSVLVLVSFTGKESSAPTLVAALK
ncbi:MAG TPA: hypothetical protein VN228_10710 [Pyrinomonadaceae bacterium]|nr:hypothetical protein [Pyrinomonadaceae bacterium]